MGSSKDKTDGGGGGDRGTGGGGRAAGRARVQGAFVGYGGRRSKAGAARDGHGEMGTFRTWSMYSSEEAETKDQLLELAVVVLLQCVLRVQKLFKMAVILTPWKGQMARNFSKTSAYV
ncbi:hypothetical protein ZEAMMB73_Zm00001d052126 [Zea mays]|uniref:Uncharacterized protein n=1 Tax=Zea mays TaxID=4577 RepID=A0A1D6QDM8_MAIZE|nr:hypothetical protein ZEAMMB73_Zm00001d052126 [Zea mays]